VALSGEERPDPDRLLSELQREEARSRRGRLRVFFGASAGVGKTYAMLEAARAARAGGADLVVGYVEPHGRVETERLLEGLEQLPFATPQYRGAALREFDIDAALQRHPAIVLVDELAHSNPQEAVPRPRHAKRWQDIDELLEAGIDVWTTVNVQHLESLNDVVAGITGVRQRETIPDHVFDRADEIELIDLPADDLLARLRAGKVYVSKQVGAAVENFFRKSNLIALRELALRRTADRVDAAARAQAAREPNARPWLVRDRLLVAIGQDAQAEQVVRAAKRMADALDAPWTAVCVETPDLLRLPEAERNRRIDVLRLAESLGAETVTLDGPTAAAVLLEYARTRNATRLLVGFPKQRGWRRLWRESTTLELMRKARGIDVIMVGAPGTGETPPSSGDDVAVGSDATAEVRWERYAEALAITAACTLVAYAMFPYFGLVNLVMIYLLGTAIAGLRLGRGPSIANSVLSVAAFDFCFVPPRYSFKVSDLEYLVTFIVMLVVGLVIANLMVSVRQQTRVAGARERRTALLYGMSRELAGTRGLEPMATVAVRHVAEVFAAQAVVLLPDAAGRLHWPGAAPQSVSFRHADLSVAQWVLDRGKPAGIGTDTLPATPAIYLPLTGTGGTLGVLGVRPSKRRRVLLPEQRYLLETFAGQIALALERAHFAAASEAASVAAERESLRNTLLASISHDLRTPLAVIAGAASTLASQSERLEPAARLELARSISEHAQDMAQLVSNVLDLTRLESGDVPLRIDWQSVEDLAGAALGRLGDRIGAHPVTMEFPADLPLVPVDAALFVQVLGNLLENAVKYTPAGTRIRLAAAAIADEVRITVEDDGPGLPVNETERLFDKFQRGREEGTVTGAGLGLSICRAIMTLHGGRIVAMPRAAGYGARFEISVPRQHAADGEAGSRVAARSRDAARGGGNDNGAVA
jgi:two-component system sensor histidine kinase KdpD